MKVGIVGLPNVGKSTLFNALTRAGASAENYPFCTIDPNLGVVDVPDPRLEVLFNLFNPGRMVPTAIEFVDVAGLVRGASRGEGLGNQFLGHIREVEAVAEVVRCFQDDNVSHVEGEIDPLRDTALINTELQLADLAAVEKRLEKTRKMTRSGDKQYLEECQALEGLAEALDRGENIRELTLEEHTARLVKELQLLTAKPLLYVANISEEEIGGGESDAVSKLREAAAGEGAGVVLISARIEADIAELEEDEAGLFLEELGIGESGLNRVIRACYSLLDLITFFTHNEKEVRAWTVSRGALAPEAAGRVHTDMERGFIRAEVVSYEDLVAAGGMSGAREKGLLRLEGHDYQVQDGDICFFRFNV